jgi:hypothetical protein
VEELELNVGEFLFGKKVPLESRIVRYAGKLTFTDAVIDFEDEKPELGITITKLVFDTPHSVNDPKITSGFYYHYVTPHQQQGTHYTCEVGYTVEVILNKAQFLTRQEAIRQWGTDENISNYMLGIELSAKLNALIFVEA